MFLQSRNHGHPPNKRRHVFIIGKGSSQTTLTLRNVFSPKDTRIPCTSQETTRRPPPPRSKQLPLDRTTSPTKSQISRIYFAHSAAKIYREFTRILRISWNTGLNRPFEVAISMIDFTPGPLWSFLYVAASPKSRWRPSRCLPKSACVMWPECLRNVAYGGILHVMSARRVF